MRGISWLTENQLAFQEGLCSIEWVSITLWLLTSIFPSNVHCLQTVHFTAWPQFLWWHTFIRTSTFQSNLHLSGMWQGMSHWLFLQQGGRQSCRNCILCHKKENKQKGGTFWCADFEEGSAFSDLLPGVSHKTKFLKFKQIEVNIRWFQEELSCE
jgi:hypothetical protein